MELAADHDVLQRGHGAEQLQVLIRSSHAGRGDLMHLPAGDVFVVKIDLAGGHREGTVDHIDRGRLAGAVRADERDDPPALHGK